MFVLQRKDGQFVARPGSEYSYTSRLQDARAFPTLESAEASRCIDNEIPVSVDELMAPSPPVTSEKHHRLFCFEVAGNGRAFPADMLRHDCCWPVRADDVYAIEGAIVGEVAVRLCSIREPTRERWASYGWTVTSIEASP